MGDNNKGKSEFEKAIIIALGVVEGQTASLNDGEGHKYVSTVKCVEDVSVMTITKDGEVWYREIYHHDSGQAIEHFY